METALIAKVAVSAAPYSIDKAYDYLIPPELAETALPGVRVTVPFGRGNRASEGIVLKVEGGEKHPGLKPLAELARLGLQRLVVQLAVGLFQRQNLVHNRLNLLELPIRVGAEQFVEKAHEVGPLPFVY